MVESGFDPTIKSPAGAAGLWQFMPDAGKIYGLSVDRWGDGRLSPLRATAAGIGYLADLKKRFGSWELSLAAYNMGYGGALATIKRFNSNDYWELSRFENGLPWETTLYVPKIIAVAIVSRNPQVFGLDEICARRLARRRARRRARRDRAQGGGAGRRLPGQGPRVAQPRAEAPVARRRSSARPTTADELAYTILVPTGKAAPR